MSEGAPIAPEHGLGASLARNTAANLAGRLVSLAGWLLVTPFMLHRLGTDRFALWSLLGILLGLYMTFDLGLSNALTKFVAEYRARDDRAGLRAVVTLGMALGVAASVVWILLVIAARGWILDALKIAPEHRVEAGQALIAAALAYGILNLWTLAGAVLTGLHRLDLFTRISIGVTLVQLAGVVLVLRAGLGVPALVAGTGAALALGLTGCWIAIRRLAPGIRLEPSALRAAPWRRMLPFSGAIQVINLGVLVQLQLEKALFPSLLSLGAVTQYELGYRVATAAWSLPSLLLPPLLPAAAHLDAAGAADRIRALHRRASRYVLAASMPVAAGVAALAPWLYAAWLGPGYGDAARAAAALAALLWINVLTSTGAIIVRGVGRPWIEGRYHLISMALHVPLSLILIPRVGFAGGLAAMLISGTVGTAWFLWRFHRLLGEPIGAFARDAIVPPAAASLVAGLAAVAIARWVSGGAPPADRHAATLGLAAGALTFALVAAGALLVTRALRVSEIREVSGLVLGRRAANRAA